MPVSIQQITTLIVNQISPFGRNDILINPIYPLSFRGSEATEESFSQRTKRDRQLFTILLKNPMNASTWLSMNGKSLMISTAPPFVQVLEG
jgi:hypothetical protein